MVTAVTEQNLQLRLLPGPSHRITVSVYDLPDLTGQFRERDNVQSLSRAVSQGGGPMLIKALQDAGERRWFTVLDRTNLDNLLRERQIIGEMRKRYLGEQEVDPNALPALLFAGVLLEGGIVGYDTNTVTGGAGAAFLGIGARTEYRQDTVTVYLRAVSVRTGEVLANVTASKTIASQAIGANAFKFVAFRELLEAEAGITSNEPDQVALQQAIEKAVYGLVLEGVELDLWRFDDMSSAQSLLAAYRAERDGQYDASDIQKAVKRAGSLTALTIVDPDKDDKDRDGS